jgi:tetratricopeptide (TPR) repeat protein
MARRRWPYWGGFTALTAAALAMLFAFVFGFLPQRFLLELDFAESGFAYPVVRPPLPAPRPLARPRRPVPRRPAERFWAEYVVLARAGADAAARRSLEDYLARYPGDLGAQLEYGRALWRLGRLDDAVTAYRRALARGGNGGARLELARLLVAARRWDEALAAYTALSRDRPGDMNLRREFAETATWAERYDLAIPLYAELAARAPDDAGLRTQWARVLYWAGRPERAAEVLERLPPDYTSAGVDSLRAAIAVALPPPVVAVEPSLLERARERAMAGDADSALALYRLHRAQNPEADSTLLEMADVLEYRAENPEGAITHLRAYLARHPDAGRVRLRLARLLAWSGRYDEAEAEARALVATRPEDAEAWVLLGDLYRWRGERKRARHAYKRALAADPAVQGASEGLAAIETEIDASLASRGTFGPGGGLDYFADSDEFRLARLRGGWSGGSPRTRAGVDLAMERLEGFEPVGVRGDLVAADLQATAERWWMDGGLNVRASLGAWIPDRSGAFEPTLSLSLSAPDWRGSAYRFEYRHGPAYRETNTLEAAIADLRADLAGLELYRPLAARWDLTATARLARFAGVGDPNLRADGGLSFLFRPDATWTLAYETRALAFGDPAPNPGRRLYWDPEWYWLNAAAVNWTGRPGARWELALRALVGAAWMRERGRDPTVEAQFGLIGDAARRFGLWTLAGRAAFSQSRADGYRAFRFELQVRRTYGR